MVKILLLVALVAFGWRVAFGRWPWDYLTAKPTRGLATYEARKLLGLPDSYSREDVIKAHRQRIAAEVLRIEIPVAQFPLHHRQHRVGMPGQRA